MDSFPGKVLGISERSAYIFENIKNFSTPFFVLDILIVALLLYGAYLFLHETRAMRILYGIIVLLAVALLGRYFNLVLLNWILKYLMTMLVVAIPIVFQPELRTALEKLGRARFISDFSLSKESSKVIEDIIAAVGILSKQKIGALIVIQRQTGLREYIENGIELNAQISRDLLLSIFFPKSPLHDGAVFIVEDRVVSARSTLPVSETYANPALGTRHRAGIGITEESDAISIIVSEETGIVSVAVGGKLERRIPEDRLKNRLVALMRRPLSKK